MLILLACLGWKEAQEFQLCVVCTQLNCTTFHSACANSSTKISVFHVAGLDTMVRLGSAMERDKPEVLPLPIVLWIFTFSHNTRSQNQPRHQVVSLHRANNYWNIWGSGIIAAYWAIWMEHHTDTLAQSRAQKFAPEFQCAKNMMIWALNNSQIPAITCSKITAKFSQAAVNYTNWCWTKHHYKADKILLKIQLHGFTRASLTAMSGGQSITFLVRGLVRFHRIKSGLRMISITWNSWYIQ